MALGPRAGPRGLVPGLGVIKAGGQQPGREPTEEVVGCGLWPLAGA